MMRSIIRNTFLWTIW